MIDATAQHVICKPALKVYLAGPITGQTVSGCTTWRHRAKEYLDSLGFDAFSPMRGKDYIEDGVPLPAFYKREPDPTHISGILSSARGVLARDHWDVKRCDILLAYFHEAERVSIGTVMEIAFAHAYDKPIVGVVDEIHEHPFVCECITHPCDNLEDALEVIKRLG